MPSAENEAGVVALWLITTSESLETSRNFARRDK